MIDISQVISMLILCVFIFLLGAYPWLFLRFLRRNFIRWTGKLKPLTFEEFLEPVLSRLGWIRIYSQFVTDKNADTCIKPKTGETACYYIALLRLHALTWAVYFVLVLIYITAAILW